MENRLISTRVAILLLNYKAVEETLACLASLSHLETDCFDIVVVDNASQDGSLETVYDQYPQVKCIQSQENLGYSGGNNLGIREALKNPQTAFVWLLNNDCTVKPDTLGMLLEMAQDKPGCLIGSLVRYPDGRFQQVGNSLKNWRGSLRRYSEDEIQDGQSVDALSGCSLLVPRVVLETIGLLDESYFLYFEDNDFCWRARNAGFSCVVAKKSVVLHKEGASTRRYAYWVTYYYQRNRLILLHRFLNQQQFRWVKWYTRYRLIRSRIKAMVKNNAEAKRHHRAFALGIRDFDKGIQGKCPHEL